MTSSDIPAAFFETEAEWFRPTAHSRGPWDANACHAGPPTGLIARAAELAVPDQRLVRVTVDLTRPIPYAGFRLEVEVLRRGRMVSTAAISLIDEEGRTAVTARTMHIATRPDVSLPSAEFISPRFADSRPGRFPLEAPLHGEPCFAGEGVEVRYPSSHRNEPGPATMWMRTVPLLLDEEPSPFQRICPLADCGNAISNNIASIAGGAINPDLALTLHREPVGDWLGSVSQSFWQADGTGMSDSLLFDELGSVGRAVQTLIINP